MTEIQQTVLNERLRCVDIVSSNVSKFLDSDEGNKTVKKIIRELFEGVKVEHFIWPQDFSLNGPHSEPNLDEATVFFREHGCDLKFISKVINTQTGETMAFRAPRYSLEN